MDCIKKLVKADVIFKPDLPEPERLTSINWKGGLCDRASAHCATKAPGRPGSH